MTTNMRKQRAQEATGSAAQTGHEVVQYNLGNVVCGSAVAGDLLSSLEAAQLEEGRKWRKSTMVSQMLQVGGLDTITQFQNLMICNNSP